VLSAAKTVGFGLARAFHSGVREVVSEDSYALVVRTGDLTWFRDPDGNTLSLDQR
jgi:hypothetical protein